MNEEKKWNSKIRIDDPLRCEHCGILLAEVKKHDCLTITLMDNGFCHSEWTVNQVS